MATEASAFSFQTRLHLPPPPDPARGSRRSWRCRSSLRRRQGGGSWGFFSLARCFAGGSQWKNIKEQRLLGSICHSLQTGCNEHVLAVRSCGPILYLSPDWTIQTLKERLTLTPEWGSVFQQGRELKATYSVVEGYDSVCWDHMPLCAAAPSAREDCQELWETTL